MATIPLDTEAAIVEMALVSDLALAAASVAANGLQASQRLIESAGRKLAAIDVGRWEHLFGLAIGVTSHRAIDDREHQLRALAEVVGAVGASVLGVEPQEGEST